MRKNIIIMKLYQLFTGMWLFSALAVVYFQDVCQSYTLAILAYTMISIVSGFAEVPLSILSDRYSRKFNIIISSICFFLNMLFWALAGIYNSVWMLFLGSSMRGLAVALQSGTDTAIIYETMCDLRSKKLFDKVYSQICSFHQMGLLVSAITGMIVTYYFPLIYLVWLSVIPAFLKIFISIQLKNPKSNADDKLTPWQQLVKSVKLLKSRKKLRNYVSMTILDGSILLTMYRFEALYFAKLIPLYLINVVRIITHTSGYFSFLLMPIFRKINFLQLLFYSRIGMAVIRIIGLVLNNALTPFVTSFTNLGYGIGVTAQTTLQQKEYNKSLRATMASLCGLLQSFLIAIMGYVFGAIADFYSVETALWVAVIVQIGIAVLYNNLFKVYKKI